MDELQIEGEGRNTLFEYRYADASNNKVHGRVVLAGIMTQDQLDRIEAGLSDGEFFIPMQVGLRDLQGDFEHGKSWEPQDDHPFHTITGVRLVDVDADGPSIDDIVSKWPTADGWDEAAAMKAHEGGDNPQLG